MIDVGVLGALLGGVLTLVSPCSALLLPSFFAYSFDRTGLLLRRTGLFYLGMLTVLAPLGAGVGAIGALLTEYRSQVTTTGGLLMATLGVAIIAGIGFRIGPAARLTARLDLSSGLSVLLLGTVYALAGFCSGPILGSVLTVAAIGSSPIYGALLMSLYSLGMAAPLFALAFAWGKLGLSQRRWIRGRELRIGRFRTHSTNLVSGGMFIAIGVFFLATDGTAALGGLTGSDTQYDVQARLQSLTAGLPNAAVALGIACAAFVVVLMRLLRARITAAGDARKRNDSTREDADDRR
ncbi:cytochrome c biogenesis CcdA family protein [Mycobacteroides abscessus]|uniref:cytochrome c biogenesis CcdA family protein n=1 Tax=Mycobacteroides abscessus TaxID=36809 RepID=UPI0002588A05|nr:cytochrome c biogenesis CcdA family protein [Mycobacteroides abscessus]EIC61947.1 putative integral membrane cytochrome c biogenesis protein [Mycobacteroides abscessus M94]MBN7457298.1 cytochrome c biogenesis protein CcdA [Mycobacteroides abscessus subsp. abscessus]MBN7546912.1 cytochrome c biogenesis protein CcdA [Mycobacteroides abscessus subsp. abscessus]MBN7571084.1 cytochrome c biogenesis protein CcdA [Mycobacteroides abscessus subsp. abscessus]MDB2197145.1 cytochrome c biogenesis CcdA